MSSHEMTIIIRENVGQPSMIEIQSEIRQLHEQLAHAGQQGRSLSDARLRIFLQSKLRYLEAAKDLRRRELTRSAAEQSERHRKPY